MAINRDPGTDRRAPPRAPTTRTLYVYECRGPRLPRTPPGHQAFLGIWPEPPYYYLFFSEPACACLQRWLENHPGWFLNDHYCIPYQAWQDVLQASERIGPFHLVPGSFSQRPDPGSLPIYLDRGIVFGSGLHPTTRGCLLALERVFRRRPPETVVDLGTGSGILAIAAARLGARHLFALDHNLMAVEEARRNIERNGFTRRIHSLVANGLEALNMDADLLIMNLEWPCLKNVLQNDPWQRHRWVIVSGFIDSSQGSLQRRLGHAQRITERLQIDAWPTLVIETAKGNTRA